MRHALARKVQFCNIQKRFLSSSHLVVNPIVQEALHDGRPVVALESTIVAHGMPYPQNWNVSRRIVDILKSKGVVPAMIAVRDGTCRIGLSDEEMLDLAQSGGNARKISTRELSLLVASQKYYSRLAPLDSSLTSRMIKPLSWGATTVASTMALARMAGIATFVTGGIGGVHRHGELSMDVSADLLELSRTPVIVVSAGIKSILDIPRTLEVLETNGVPVVTYQADEFPAFFSPKSGVPSPYRMDHAVEIAQAYLVAHELGFSHGMLVAVPNRDPAGEHVEDAIQAALQEAEQRNIRGPGVTPFILKRVSETTEGESLKSNMALVEQNAEVGADIALALASLRRSATPSVISDQQHMTVCAASTSRPTPSDTHSARRVLVMGGAVIDIVAKPQQTLMIGTSNPVCCTESDGGVARNVAEALGRLGTPTTFYSAVGNDSRGAALLHRLKNECYVEWNADSVMIASGLNTATYLAVLEHDGDLHVAGADMEVLQLIPPLDGDAIMDAAMLVLDANALLPTIRSAAHLAYEKHIPILWEPTSVPKARAIAQDDAFMSYLSYATPNLDELWAIDGKEPSNHFVPALSTRGITGDTLQKIQDQACSVLNRMNPAGACLVITLGKDGVLLASTMDETTVSGPIYQYLPNNQEHVIVRNATGAGDSLAGAFVHGLVNGMSREDAVKFGMNAALTSLECADRAVSADIARIKKL